MAHLDIRTGEHITHYEQNGISVEEVGYTHREVNEEGLTVDVHYDKYWDKTGYTVHQGGDTTNYDQYWNKK